jgi:Transposase.
MENDIIATTRQVKRQCYVLAVFFYSNRIVYTEFIPEDSTVNKTLYKEILGRLRDSIRRK